MSYSLAREDSINSSLRLSPAVATASTQGGHAWSAIVPGRHEMHGSSSNRSRNRSHSRNRSRNHSRSRSRSRSFRQKGLIDASLTLSPAVATASTPGGHASSAIVPWRRNMHGTSSSSNSIDSHYPDRSGESSSAAASVSTQGGHASSAIVPVTRDRGIPQPMMCYVGLEEDYGNHFRVLDMGGVACHDWLLLECGVLATVWVALPGRSGSFIRLREARLDLGEAGLALFPWGNYRGISQPGMPEITMDFTNSTAPGHPHYFSLEPEDCLVWCPMKYVWPACGCCALFLYPPEQHRQTKKHKSRVAWMKECTKSQPDLEHLRSDSALRLSKKNQHGQDFGRCSNTGRGR